MNTAASVAVVEITAKKTSLVPATAAAFRPRPSRRLRTMFSTTTIASSTTRPVARTSARSVMELTENPVAQIAATVLFTAVAYVAQRQAAAIGSVKAAFPAEEYLAMRLEMDGDGLTEERASTVNESFLRRYEATARELEQRVAADARIAGATLEGRLPLLPSGGGVIELDDVAPVRFDVGGAGGTGDITTAVDHLADALVARLDLDPGERARQAASARANVAGAWGWDHLAHRVAELMTGGR